MNSVSNYPFVSLSDQKPLTQAQLARAGESVRYVRNLVDSRARYLADHSLEPAIWMPSSIWGVEHALHRAARALLDGDRHTIEFLRIYSQQFTGVALWSMSKGEGQPLAPMDRAALEKSVEDVRLDDAWLATYKEFRNMLPDYLRINPPAQFGEVGWLVDGGLANLDVLAYWERLILLNRFGFLDRRSPRALQSGSRILEIGGGYGGLAWYIQEAVPGVDYTLLDIPESLAYSSIYLNVLHPGQTRLLANFQLPELEGQRFDLVLNTLSMSEMSEAQVRAYCKSIAEMIGSEGSFFEQNFDNRCVGMLNAQDIIAGYFRQESHDPGYWQGPAHLWSNRD
jgi:hypothetical protein